MDRISHKHMYITVTHFSIYVAKQNKAIELCLISILFKLLNWSGFASTFNGNQNIRIYQKVKYDKSMTFQQT